MDWLFALLTYISYFPYNDSAPVRYRSIPFGTLSLIAVNVVVHLTLLADYRFDPIGLYQQWLIYGSVPDRIQAAWGLPGVAAISSTFLHGGLLHLFFNMVALWTFGKRVEDACGTLRFLLFYLTAGLMGNWLPIVAEAVGLTGDGSVPGIGASGAIAGVMGAYLILFPGTKVSGLFAITVFCVIPIPYRVRLPAVVYLFYFLILQLYYTYVSVTEKINFGVGFLAHLGGFFSALLVFLYLRKDVFFRYWTKADL